MLFLVILCGLVSSVLSISLIDGYAMVIVVVKIGSSLLIDFLGVIAVDAFVKLVGEVVGFWVEGYRVLVVSLGVVLVGVVAFGLVEWLVDLFML